MDSAVKRHKSAYGLNGGVGTGGGKAVVRGLLGADGLKLC